MAEFFIDLVSKLEEMTPELKKLVKTLFCGVLSNNVVSLVSVMFIILTFEIPKWKRRRIRSIST